MALSVYIIKKYLKILIGKNDMTVNQTEGKCYSKNEVEGYYNDLTEKITKFGFSGNQVPISEPAPGVKMEFSIAIFQYGLAAYDLYLLTKDESYLGKLKACTEWALENQEENGAWPTFTYKRPDQLYSAMAQGEALSLLVRAHKVFGDDRYLKSAKKAKEFMMLPIEQGGTTIYENGYIYLYEYVNAPQVLNGWIFSAWGLFDYGKYLNDLETLEQWENTTMAIAKKLPHYDNGFWSLYSNGGGISNPFYHKLHISLLNTMYELTGIIAFKKYSDIFTRYQNKRWNCIKAFVIKMWQKTVSKD